MNKYSVLALYLLYLSLRMPGFSYPTKVTVTMFDVGQGDAIMLEIDSKIIIVDGGPTFEIDRLLNRKLPINKCYIDVVVITHPHKDHINGLKRLNQHCEIGLVVYNIGFYGSLDIQSYIGNSKIIELTYTDTVYIGEVGLHVFWPMRDFPDSNINNNSIVLLLDYKEFEMLLMGDIETTSSVKLDIIRMQEYIQDNLDVFKIPHQGSIDSLNSTIFSVLKPKVCLLSVGKGNHFGHPHPKTIETINNYECSLFRTDYLGTIEVYVY
ncbi:ComEC/Rec2 family competence protein [Patescibacteria group bacterium]